MGVLERLRMAVDTARYTDFAFAREGATAYAIRDFDCDNLAELLLASVAGNGKNAYTLTLDLYKLAGGEIRLADSRAFENVLLPGTEMQVVLVKQGGRELIYFAERNMLLSANVRSQALTVVDNKLTGVTLTPSSAYDTSPLLVAGADAQGNVILQDYSGLDAENVETPDVKDAASSIVLVLITIIRSILRGNG